MDSTQQRWLSLEGICSTLSLSHTNIKYLVNQGVIPIMHTRGKDFKTARFLDPTPEFAEKMKLGEALYGRLDPIPHDLDFKCLLTVREVAEIMGWKLYYARKYMKVYKIQGVRAGKYYLYPVQTIREFLWKRNGRALAHQRSPFILSRLVAWFLQHHNADNDVIPTDQELAKDDVMMRKLTRISKLKGPRREEALKEFLEKVEMAKMVALQLSQEVVRTAEHSLATTTEDPA